MSQFYILVSSLPSSTRILVVHSLGSVLSGEPTGVLLCPTTLFMVPELKANELLTDVGEPRPLPKSSESGRGIEIHEFLADVGLN